MPFPAYTARDLITRSLKRLGVISGIETPSADLAKDGLDCLNGLIETWSTEALTLWCQTALSPIALVAGKETYTLGPTGDVILDPAPRWIDRVTLLVITTPTPYEVPLEPVSREDWQLVRMKTLSSPWPTHYHFEPTWPLSELRLWPIYSGGNVETIVISVPEPITAGVTLDTVFDFPPGYYRALRDSLALELAPEVGRPVDGALVAAAMDAKGQLQRVNYRPRELHPPPELGCRQGNGGTQASAYNWITDE